jgi:hypothetical protein
MNDRPDRSLALDLVSLDLADRDALVEFLALHAVSPARCLYHMPEPATAETIEELDAARSAYAQTPGSYFGLDVSTALFDRFIAGYVLFVRLFPAALRDSDGTDVTLAVPNWAYFEHSLQLSHFLRTDIENLVDGLFDGSGSGPDHSGLERRYAPERNDAGFDELRSAQLLTRAALCSPTALTDPAYRRRQIRLRAMDQGTTFAIDEILRAQVHQRLVWFASVDITFSIGYTDQDASGNLVFVPEEGDEPLEITDDHGVFPTVIPETISGVVALDLVSTFRRPREVGVCEHCGQTMLLSGPQAARADSSLPVYHPACRDPHRLAYFRRKANERYQSERIHTTSHVPASVKEA